MANVVFVPRSRWRRAHWRIAGSSGPRKPRRSRGRRWRRRNRRWPARTWTVIALAFIAAAVLLNLERVQDLLGVRATERLTAVAIDGDSLRTGGKDIRIRGIDAPELNQTCRDERGAAWSCGREARARLRALIASGPLECTMASTDRYGRALATCATPTVPDIGEAMVRAGYAVSFMGLRYWSAEREARAGKRGIWRGTFDMPQDWRDAQQDYR